MNVWLKKCKSDSPNLIALASQKMCFLHKININNDSKRPQCFQIQKVQFIFFLLDNPDSINSSFK